MTGSHEQCSRTPDASLYVLGELRGRQQDSFALHLRHCEACADEVDLLQQVAGAMPLLSAQQVSVPEEEPRVHQRVPTLAVAANNARAAADNARAAASDADALASAGRQLPTARPVLRSIEGGAAVRARPVSRRRLLKNPIPKPALIGLLAVGVLATATVALSSAGANVRYYRIQAGWSGGGAAVQLMGGKLKLLVEGMPKPASGTGYEVWVVDRATTQLKPTGSWLRLNRLGQAGVTVPGDYHDWTAVAVYTEPLRGRDTTISGAAIVGDLRRVN